jgi:hypothetical protein
MRHAIEVLESYVHATIMRGPVLLENSTKISGVSIDDGSKTSNLIFHESSKKAEFVESLKTDG